MRICFVVNEIFNWGYFGGFGALTRTIGRELVKKGIEVFVIMPQNSPNQRLIENLDGMTILGIPSKRRSFTPRTSIRSRKFFKLCDADIYHSEEPSVGTYVATKVESKKKHLITFQDPRNLDERKQLWAFDIPDYNRNLIKRWLLPYNYKFDNYFIRKAIHHVDERFTQAKYVIPKIKSLYKLRDNPRFLPNPVRMPINPGKKSKEPHVCFLARWDEVKRPELFFELAKLFPDIRFTALGKSPNIERDEYLRTFCHDIKNLECPGFLDEEKKSEVLKSCWIYVNTSIRECLPVAFLEAAAHKCAILSSENPDGFAENFGYRVSENNLRGYTEGLENLLKNDLWKISGTKGFDYVREVHEMGKVIDQHIKVYEKLVIK